MKTSLKIEREECGDDCSQNYPVLYSRILGKVLEMRSVRHCLLIPQSLVSVLGSFQQSFSQSVSNLHKVVQLEQTLVARAPLLRSQEEVAGEVSAEVSGGDCTEAEDGGSALVWTGGKRGGASGYQVNIPDTCLQQ